MPCPDCKDSLDQRELLDQCGRHIAERNRLSDALVKIARIADTGSSEYYAAFDTAPGQPVVNGWRVAEKMREVALEAVSVPCEWCGDRGQVQLTDEGGNKAWWPCPACSSENIKRAMANGWKL